MARRPSQPLGSVLSPDSAAAVQDTDAPVHVGDRIGSGPAGSVFKLADEDGNDAGLVTVVGNTPVKEGKHKLSPGTVVIRSDGVEYVVDPNGKVSTVDGKGKTTPENKIPAEEQIILRNLADDARKKAAAQPAQQNRAAPPGP